MSCLLEVYKKFNIEVSRADGRYLWDSSGKKYTDFLSGISVTNFGHRPPEVVKSVSGAVSEYMHVSNLFNERKQELLAERLVKKSFPGKVFFANSGAEANETAVKAARKYFDGDKYEIISFQNSFHGRTLAMLAATGQARLRSGFGPVPEGFLHGEYNFLASAEDKIGRKTCAIMVEVIQGEGGVLVGEDNFIKGLRKICDENGLLLIIDEIQTGMGRTGSFFGYDYYGIKPDIVTMGKALGGGLPLGACIIGEKAAPAMKPGDHGSTFGGNPVCCAASLSAVGSLTEGLLSGVREKGEYLLRSMRELARGYEVIKDVRGRGLMAGVELKIGGAGLIEYLLERGIIAGCTREKVIRFLPPFVIEKEDIDRVVQILSDYFKEKT